MTTQNFWEEFHSEYEKSKELDKKEADEKKPYEFKYQSRGILVRILHYKISNLKEQIIRIFEKKKARYHRY